MIYNEIYNKFSKTMSEKCMISPVQDCQTQSDSKIIAAVSGGSDSVCLLIMLKQYFGSKNIICAHFNHRLRGDEADRDEDFTKKIAYKLEIEYICGSGDVRRYASENGLGIEEAARKLRYDFLQKTAGKYKKAFIATGHNLGDRLETIIFNIARGTSVDGLKGIDYRTGILIRPLLDITKKETEEVCSFHGIKPMIDSTNADNAYTRNMIRSSVLPYLKNIFGEKLEEHILRLSDSAATDSSYLNIRTAEAFNECCTEQEHPFRRIILDTAEYSGLHTAIKKRLIRYMMSRIQDENGNVIFPDNTGIYSSMIESVYTLAENMKTGKRIDLPMGLKCISEAECISFIHESCLVNGQKKIYEGSRLNTEIIEIEDLIKIKNCTIQDLMKNKKNNEEIFDADKLNEIAGGNIKIEFRAGMTGDHFTPFGAQGGKSLNKFYIDRKISRSERAYIRVAALNNEILWIPGVRRSAAAPIDKNTTRVIILRCISNTEVGR